MKDSIFWEYTTTKVHLIFVFSTKETQAFAKDEANHITRAIQWATNEIAFPIHRDRLFLAMTKERLTIKVKTKLATKWRNNRVLDETLWNIHTIKKTPNCNFSPDNYWERNLCEMLPAWQSGLDKVGRPTGRATWQDKFAYG